MRHDPSKSRRIVFGAIITPTSLALIAAIWFSGAVTKADEPPKPADAQQQPDAAPTDPNADAKPATPAQADAKTKVEVRPQTIEAENEEFLSRVRALGVNEQAQKMLAQFNDLNARLRALERRRESLFARRQQLRQRFNEQGGAASKFSAVVLPKLQIEDLELSRDIHAKEVRQKTLEMMISEEQDKVAREAAGYPSVRKLKQAAREARLRLERAQAAAAAPAADGQDPHASRQAVKDKLALAYHQKKQEMRHRQAELAAQRRMVNQAADAIADAETSLAENGTTLAVVTKEFEMKKAVTKNPRLDALKQKMKQLTDAREDVAQALTEARDQRPSAETRVVEMEAAVQEVASVFNRLISEQGRFLIEEITREGPNRQADVKEAELALAAAEERAEAKQEELQKSLGGAVDRLRREAQSLQLDLAEMKARRLAVRGQINRFYVGDNEHQERFQYLAARVDGQLDQISKEIEEVEFRLLDVTSSNLGD